MLDAGYSPSTARQGKAALSKPMLEALAREWNMLELLGRKISPERQENLVRGRLVLNTLNGRDDAVQSAKLLGSDRRVAMWKDGSVTGMIVLQVPKSVPTGLEDLSLLKGEVEKPGELEGPRPKVRENR